MFSSMMQWIIDIWLIIINSVFSFIDTSVDLNLR